MTTFTGNFRLHFISKKVAVHGFRVQRFRVAFSTQSHNQNSSLTVQQLRFALNFEPLNPEPVNGYELSKHKSIVRHGSQPIHWCILWIGYNKFDIYLLFLPRLEVECPEHNPFLVLVILFFRRRGDNKVLHNDLICP